MPEYKQSKSQKRSKSQSKNGGRRRKHTMRKLRRGKKSRKVMRGGGLFEYADLKKIFDKDQTQTQMKNLLNVYKVESFDEFKTKYQDGIPSEQLNIRGLITDIQNKNGDDELINFLQANTPP